jgi:hypothetical protein
MKKSLKTPQMIASVHYTHAHTHTYMSSIFLLKYKEVFVSKYEIWGMLKEIRGAFWSKSIVL